MTARLPQYGVILTSGNELTVEGPVRIKVIHGEATVDVESVVVETWPREDALKTFLEGTQAALDMMRRFREEAP